MLVLQTTPPVLLTTMGGAQLLGEAESEVRGGMDVLKVIFWDHAFQPRAAGKNGNFWYV
jgi:hypothetical protein